MDAPVPTAERPAGAPTTLARRLRALAPWALAAAVLAWLFHRLPLRVVGAALAAGPWPQLAAYVVAEVLLILLADVAAASVALRTANATSASDPAPADGDAIPLRRLLAMRGATYLLSIVHPVAGQGSFGWFLARAGRSGWNAGGLVLLLLVTQALALGVAAALGLLVAPESLRALTLPVVALLAAGMLAYLAIIGLRPRRLAALPLLEPLFDAGVRGHLVTVAARLPHVALLVLLQWGAFRVWGIPVPLVAALGLTPIVLFVAALPITPGGLGTVQAVQASFFARFALAATVQERGGAVVALSLAHVALGVLVQMVVGIVCLQVLRRYGLEPAEERTLSGAVGRLRGR